MVKKLFFFFTFTFLNSFLFANPLILLSQPTRPFVEVAQGIEKKFSVKGEVELLQEHPQDIFIHSPWFAIGNGALRYLLQHSKEKKIFVSLIESPEQFLKERRVCGYRIETDPDFIRSFLIKIKKLLKRDKIYIFTSEKSTFYIKKIITVISDLNIEVIKLKKINELYRKLDKIPPSRGILYIVPDPAIISITTVTQILKESVKRRIPVLGYNKWFVANGAFAATYLDYLKIGEKLAELSQKRCEGIKYPPARIIVNMILAKRWKIKVHHLQDFDQWDGQ